MKRAVMKPILISAVLLAMTGAPAHALDPNEMFDDPVLEQRARDLGRELRCVKCRNQSIFDSNAGIAQDMRVVVRERIAAGDSDEEVLEWLRERYGDYVLLNPRATGQTALLWLAPLGFLVLSGLGAGVYLYRHAGGGDAPDPALSDEDRARAQALLSGREKTP
ncbi:MAG: cytochrome c-type biogenesis protein CcmH [Mangrovicoccus sp.]|nr:cytochrome c-type biogenesis protein CcmH [Mangrovicoccus sp.]